MPEIRFSIVIACYNQEAFIKETVESALSQKHPNKEIIVVDDCSSDGTADILRSFGESITMTTLPQNSGVYTSRNHGASLAKGEYLVFLDGDDVLMPWSLDAYDQLVTVRSPKIILGRAILFNGKVPEVNKSEIPKNIQFVEYEYFLSKDRSNLYNTSALVVNRSHFWSAGGWSNGIFYQDIQDLLSKLGASGKMIFVLDPGTVWYRMHSTNAVKNVLPFVEGIRVLLKNASLGKYPGGLKCKIERSAWYGGLAVYWAKEAIRIGFYWKGFKLLVSCWWMILFAVMKRGMSFVLGRKPIEQLPFKYITFL